MKAHFQIALLLVVSSSARRILARRIQTPHDKVAKLAIDHGGMDASTVVEPSFFLVQLADPQLGMLNLDEDDMEDAMDFGAELENLHDAVRSIKNLNPQPGVVVMSGDMQNFWSKDFSKNKALGPESGLGDYGEVQALAVKTAMEPLKKKGIEVVYTPGNHDLDDVVSMDLIQRYKRIWGADYYSFSIGNVFFISINSQLYFDKLDDPDVEAYTQAQSDWIEAEFKRVQAESPAAIVFLTHIPPFIGSRREPHGWANWDKDFRDEIFQKLMDKKVQMSPELWLCGHFHGNVRSQEVINDRLVEVVTTGSVGATMMWNNTVANVYSPKHASEIASLPSGGLAFFKHIMDGSKENKDTLVPQRITTSKDSSGLRIVQFFTNGQYRHKWFTLAEFASVTSIDDESMKGAYTSSNWVSN